MGIYLRDFYVFDFVLLKYCLSQSVTCVWVCRIVVSTCVVVLG